jgi:hypothetical protein
MRVAFGVWALSLVPVVWAQGLLGGVGAVLATATQVQNIRHLHIHTQHTCAHTRTQAYTR